MPLPLLNKACNESQSIGIQHDLECYEIVRNTLRFHETLIQISLLQQRANFSTSQK